MNEGRRYAVLIGSSRFDKDTTLTRLNSPENDVDGMRQVLAAAELGAFEEPLVFENADSHVVMHGIEETLSADPVSRVLKLEQLCGLRWRQLAIHPTNNSPERLPP